MATARPVLPLLKHSWYPHLTIPFNNMLKKDARNEVSKMRISITILISICFGMILNGTFDALQYTSHLQMSLSDQESDAPTNSSSSNPPNSNTNNDHMCTSLLQQFRTDQIPIARKEGDVNFRRSYVTIAKDLPHPFYVATHEKEIDFVRAAIMTYQKYYETKLSLLIANIYKKRSGEEEGKKTIFLDVGANIGWFSLVAASHGASQVYSFEPNLQNTIRFCESLSLNGFLVNNFVVPVSKGVGNMEEQRELYIPNNSNSNPGAFTFQKQGRNATVVGTMEITTLDSFAEQQRWFKNKPSIPIFKLDVEHFELEALQGAKRLLNSGIIENIAMELKPEQTKEAKLGITTILFDAGYELYAHGNFRGPGTLVEKNYTKPQDLLVDLEARMYNENVLFKLKSIKQGVFEELVNARMVDLRVAV